MNDYWQTIIKILEKQDYNFSVEDLLDAIWITPYIKSVSWDSRASTDSFADISQILQKIQTDSMLKEATSEKREKETNKDEELQGEISSREGEELEESDIRDADLYLPKSTSISGTDIGSKIFRIPAAPILSDALQLSRALRLFMQRIPSKINYSIDEEKTAHRIAEEGIWTPALIPSKERWFEVELIVDAGTSMNVWNGIGYEFLDLLRWMGAFRNIRAWSITTDDPQPRLYAGLQHPRISSQERTPSELTNTNGRRLILVLTDCISRAWHSDGMLKSLNLWASKGPTAIIQVFPFHLWSRTALHSFETVSFFTSSPALPNIRLPYEFLYTIPEPDENNEKTGLPVPVLSIDPVSIANWTKLVTGVSGDEVLGCIFRQKDEEFPVGQKTAPKLPPEKCIKLFWQLASPTAIRLALLISASPAISLQIMRIIRNAMLPEATHVDEAEVLLAGLLKPTTQIDENNFKPGDVQYEFRGDIRWKLLENLPISESIKVLDVVSTYIEEHIGNIRNFRAVLADPSKTEGTISIGNNPIARVTGEILQSLGGDYARLVKQKKKKIQKRKTQYKPQKIVECQTPGGDNLQLFKRKKKGVHKPPRRVEVQQINLNTPSRRIIIHAVRILKKGGIIVYPTDTIYGLAADIYNKSAISHIYKIKKVSKQKLMTLIFSDLKGIGDWVHVPRPAFRVMRRVLPGKYTFILPANIEVQKLIFPKRRTLGIRIPDNEVSRLLVEKLGNPLISTSVPKDKNDFFTDPYEIAERFKYEIDLVLDAGLMPNLQSTIVDCTVEPPEILREGAGDVDDLFGI